MLQRPTRPAAGLALRLAYAAALAYVLLTMLLLAAHDQLTSIADDSSNYLVMARYLSPWAPPDEAIRSVWHQQYFPRVFPALLAVTGAGHSLLAAHLLVLALGLLCLPLLARLARTGPCGSAAGPPVALLFALAPGFFLGLQGILSESLYLLLSLCVLLAWQRGPHARTGDAVTGLLLAGAVLTRTIGLVLVAAFVLQSCVALLRSGGDAWRGVRVAGWAMLAVAGVALVSGSEAGDEYARVWSALAAHLLQAGGTAPVAYLAGQFDQLADAWLAYFLVYWSAGFSLPGALLLGAGAVALLGTIAGGVRNSVAAWYVLGYLGVLALWPYPGQQVRMLFPVVPLLLVFAAWQYCSVVRTGLWRGATLAAMLAVTLPAHAFLHGRAALARELGLVPVYEWLRKPEYREAMRELRVQNRLLEDFARLSRSTSPNHLIAYYEPSYVALLGARRSVRADWPAQLQAGAGGATHVLLTAIHPRMTRTGIDGLQLAGPVPDRYPQWCSEVPPDGAIASCLYRIHD